jgi:uncharacterized coiled-coil protein SlyX
MVMDWLVSRVHSLELENVEWRSVVKSLEEVLGEQQKSLEEINTRLQKLEEKPAPKEDSRALKLVCAQACIHHGLPMLLLPGCHF